MGTAFQAQEASPLKIESIPAALGCFREVVATEPTRDLETLYTATLEATSNAVPVEEREILSEHRFDFVLESLSKAHLYERARPYLDAMVLEFLDLTAQVPGEDAGLGIAYFVRDPVYTGSTLAISRLPAEFRESLASYDFESPTELVQVLSFFGRNTGKAVAYDHVRKLDLIDPEEHKVQSLLFSAIEETRSAEDLSSFYGSGFEVPFFLPLDLQRVGAYRIVADLSPDDLDSDMIRQLRPGIPKVLAPLARLDFSTFQSQAIELVHPVDEETHDRRYSPALDHKKFKLVLGSQYDLELEITALLPNSGEEPEARVGCFGRHWIPAFAKWMDKVHDQYFIPHLDRMKPQILNELEGTGVRFPWQSGTTLAQIIDTLCAEDDSTALEPASR